MELQFIHLLDLRMSSTKFMHKPISVVEYANDKMSIRNELICGRLET